MNAPRHGSSSFERTLIFMTNDAIRRRLVRRKRIEHWLTLIAGLLLAYTVFCFIAMEGWK